MVLKKAAAFGLALMVLMAMSSYAQVEAHLAVMTAAHVQKAVPGTDKSTAEVVGTVRQTFSLTVCGVTGTVVVLNVNGLPIGNGIPVVGTCGGNQARPCKALKVGSRIRLQGLMVPIPDQNQAGFNICDPDTWEVFTASQTFTVLKVLK